MGLSVGGRFLRGALVSAGALLAGDGLTKPMSLDARRAGAGGGGPGAPAQPTLTAPTSTAPSPNATLIFPESIALAATGDVGLSSMTWIAYQAGQSPGHASAVEIGSDTDGGDANYSDSYALDEGDLDVATYGFDWAIVARATNGAGSTDSSALSITVAHRHRYVDTFFANGTANLPANILGPNDSTRNRIQEEGWGPGGDGQANTGGGGGGEYARNNSASVTPSATRAVVVPAGGSGSNTTIASTSLIATAGQNRTAGGAGGTGGTGDVTNAGGNGATGTGNQLGGGGAGSSTAASGTTPGEPDGGYGQPASDARLIAGGGGSSSGAGRVGRRGEARLVYDVPAAVDNARVIGRSHGRNDTSATSHNVTFPAGTGGTLLCVPIVDGAGLPPTISMPGWTARGSQQNEATGQLCGAVFSYDASGGDPSGTGAIGLSGNGRISWRIWRVGGAGTIGVTWAEGSSTNGDSPDHTLSGTVNALVLSVLGLDMSGAVSLTAGPSGYGSVLSQPAASNLGTGIFSAEKHVTAAASENPGAWTNDAEQWVAATIALEAP